MHWMKKAFSTLFLTTKIVALLCFSNMGLMNMGGMAHAAMPMPCHDETVDQSISIKACDTCVAALEAWEEPLTAVKLPTLSSEVKTVSFGYATKTGIVKRALQEKVFYRPPPNAVLKAAFYHPKTSIVLIV
jgi:hypothetical protein